MLHEDRERALSFGTDPDLYHRTRPTYPPELLDNLLADGAGDVLDVGCGTGIASALFAQRGCRVLGVEADPRMADYARRRGLEAETATFEEWDPAGRAFDLVISGQAWHWVDPERGARVAAGVLRPGGRIGLFWNRAAHPEPVQAAFDSAYRTRAPQLGQVSIVLGRGTDGRYGIAAAGLEAVGSFGPVEQLRFPWETTYTKDRWLDHLQTHSDHRALPERELRELLAAIGEAIDALGGTFTTRYETILVTARRA